MEDISLLEALRKKSRNCGGEQMRTPRPNPPVEFEFATSSEESEYRECRLWKWIKDLAKQEMDRELERELEQWEKC